MRKYQMLFMVLICSVMMVACGDQEAVEDTVREVNVNNGQEDQSVAIAEALVNSYYEFAAEKEIESMVALFSEGLLEDAGGYDITVTTIEMRTFLIGEIESYEISESSVGELDGVPGIKCYVSVSYVSGQEVVEEFVVIDGVIVDIILPNQDNTNRIIENYFMSFGDKEMMQACLLPIAIENMDMEDYYKKADLFSELLGEYVGYEIVDEMYTDSSVGDITCYYVANTVYAYYENMTLFGTLQIGYEDGLLGLNYEGFYPEITVLFMEEYLYRMQNDDIDGMMDLYSETFYVEMDETPENWKETIETMMGEMSDQVSYTIYDWDYMLMPLSDGREMPILGYTASVNYNGTEYIERFILNYDGNSYQIQKYNLSTAE